MSITSRAGFVVALVMLMTQGAGAQERTYPGAMCVEVQNGKPLDQRQKVSRNSEGESGIRLYRY